MAKNNKADMSCARVKKYTASDVSKAERHNERKNETYENMNVIEERIPFNVHFKKPFAPTYMEQLKQMETNGLVSLRGLRKDATLFPYTTLFRSAQLISALLFLAIFVLLSRQGEAITQHSLNVCNPL